MTVSAPAFQPALDHVDRHRDDYLDVLFELVRRPSISGQAEEVNECAGFLENGLLDSGINARILPTGGAPVVFGELGGQSPFTVLFYGHYDVQPPEPLEGWDSPPFEPTIRDGRIYARGAGDNKGQLLAHVLAVRSFLETSGAPPVNVKFVFDGEEESGSPHLHDFVERNRELLAADLVYTADGGYHDSGLPLVCFGVRGIVAVELEARGAERDLHSGNRGNLVPNPAWQLIDLLRTMRTPAGRVTIESFYDGIREPTEFELALLARAPFDREAFAKSVGLAKTDIRDAAEYGHRLMFEPTFNIAGLSSGHAGDGLRTIIPSSATVRLDMRLVADQDPDRILELLEAHVRTHAPEVIVRSLGSMRPSKTSPELPVARRIVDAVAWARGLEPVIVPCLGGSLPDYVWTHVLGAPSVIVPYANADESNHAPNENLEVEAFFAGIRTSIVVLEALRGEAEGVVT